MRDKNGGCKRIPISIAVWVGAVAASAGIAGQDLGTREPRTESQVRRVTLEQVKQAADPVASPMGRLGQLSIEAAKQHRLSTQADYFPKFGATALNLHFTDFLGQFLTIRRPIAGTIQQVPVPIFGQNQTVAALTFTQPLTPLFIVYQAVKIARADERIAIAKATSPAAKNQRDRELEEVYFNLLIAQRKAASAEMTLQRSEERQLYAGTSIQLAGGSSRQAAISEARTEFEKLNSKVKELRASLNLAMSWPEDTELELAIPEPLVEDLSLEEVSDKSAAGNAELVEAQETVVKARAAETIAKLAYVPTVAAVSGYVFQNAIPAVPSNFGYGGAIASYTLFDFGKREHDIKEARAKYEMAETALQLTKAKVAGNVKKSYLELQRSRELSQIAQKMGSSVAQLLNVSSSAESIELKAAKAEVEVQMLEADLAHRQAYGRLMDLTGSKQFSRRNER